MEFDGRVVIVTGAGGAIGGATATLFAGQGAAVVVADTAASGLDDVTARCASAGAQPLPLVFDLGHAESIDGMVRDTLARFGRIDVLANVAGTWGFAPVSKTTDELWEKTLKVNLTGTFLCCRQSLPALRESGGVIVNVASGAAFAPTPNVGAYAASKAGIVAFSRVLALEEAPAVRVNVVAPGPTETPTHAARGDVGTRMADSVTAGIPLGRMATPDEVAEGILFVASPRARFVTGATLHVNGGRFMA